MLITVLRPSVLTGSLTPCVLTTTFGNRMLTRGFPSRHWITCRFRRFSLLAGTRRHAKRHGHCGDDCEASTS
jgi:hypothetical protein